MCGTKTTNGSFRLHFDLSPINNKEYMSSQHLRMFKEINLQMQNNNLPIVHTHYNDEQMHIAEIQMFNNVNNMQLIELYQIP